MKGPLDDFTERHDRSSPFESGWLMIAVVSTAIAVGELAFMVSVALR